MVLKKFASIILSILLLSALASAAGALKISTVSKTAPVPTTRILDSSTPLDPTTVGKHDPTEEDISNFIKWIGLYNSLCATVRTSVKDTIMAAVGESVGSVVWNSVYNFGETVTGKANIRSALKQVSDKMNQGAKQSDFIAAMVGSCFPDIAEWRYYNGTTEGYPYQPGIDLWNNGFLVSCDMGGTWRLHCAADGAILYSVEKREIAENEAFSCIVSKRGRVYWQAGIDSCDALISRFKLSEEKASFAKVKVVPTAPYVDETTYRYLHPDRAWNLVMDETAAPSWFTQEHENAAMRAFEQWKKTVYRFDYAKALDPFDPALAGKAQTPTKEDITLLKQWAAVWKSVRASESNIKASVTASGWHAVGPCIFNDAEHSVQAAFRVLHVACPGAVVCAGIEAELGADTTRAVNDAIGDSVGDVVSALVGSYFIPNITEWKYYEGDITGYPYQSGAGLWARGFIPSFDGKLWRLSSGPEASVVLEITEEELMKVR